MVVGDCLLALRANLYVLVDLAVAGTSRFHHSLSPSGPRAALHLKVSNQRAPRLHVDGRLARAVVPVVILHTQELTHNETLGASKTMPEEAIRVVPVDCSASDAPASSVQSRDTQDDTLATRS